MIPLYFYVRASEHEMQIFRAGFLRNNSRAQLKIGWRWNHIGTIRLRFNGQFDAVLLLQINQDKLQRQLRGVNPRRQ